MGVKVVTAYVTEDGKMFVTKAAANVHEDMLNTRAQVIKWVSDHCYSGMSQCDVTETLLEYQDELRVALGGEA